MNAQQILVKIKAYPLALALLGTAIVLAGWSYYRSDSLDDLRGELDTVTADNDQTSTNVQDGINFKEQVDQLTAAVAQFKTALIKPDDIIPNQQFFYDYEQSTGVQILDPIEGGTVVSKDPAEPSVTTFKLSASGTWVNLITLLNALQNGPPFLRFSQFGLERAQQARTAPGGDAGTSELIHLTLTIDVLGQ